MRYNFVAYCILLLTFLLAFGAAHYFPDSELLRATIVFPVIGVLYQLARDQATYEKELEKQSRQFQFTIGAASHIANTAFDKHAEFGERYMKEVHEMVHTLWLEGETDKVLTHASNLFAVREEFACWLTQSVELELGKFEGVLRKLGANARFIKSTTYDSQYAEHRVLKINSNFELFSDILGLDPHAELNEDYAVESIKRKVRNILGTEELTLLRAHLVKQAAKLAQLV